MTRKAVPTVTRMLMASVVVLLCGAGREASAGDISSNVDVQLWGRAKLDVHYDNADLRGFTDFATNISSDPEDYDAELNFNPRDTRFGFKAQLKDGEMTAGAVMEIDYYGDNLGNNLLPRLRLGYAFVDKGALNVRFGQDWIPIAQQNPATIDFGILSYGGNLWWRVPQITVRYKAAAGLELLGSAMKHRIQSEVDHQEVMPWLIGRAAYSGFLNDKGMLAIGAGFRSVEVDSIDYSPFLIAGEAVLPFTEQIQLTAEVYSGKGVGEEFVHYGFEYNPVHPDDDEDEGRAIATVGGFADLAFKVSPKFTIDVGAGMDDPDEDDAEGLAVLPYTKNTVIFGNLKYQLTKYMVMGVEVMNFTTEHGEDAEGEVIDYTGQRVTFSSWFTF